MESNFRIVIDENCFLRGKPGTEAAEQADGANPCLPGENDSGIEDEIFSGWAVRVFPETEENGWIRIETHYGYSGYVAVTQLSPISRLELIRRQDRTRFFRIGVPVADLLDRPKVQGLPLERLLKNAIVERIFGEENKAGTKGGVTLGTVDAQSESVMDVEETTAQSESSVNAESANVKSERLTNSENTDGWCLIRTAAGRVGDVHENYLRERKDDDAYFLWLEGDASAHGTDGLEAMDPEGIASKNLSAKEVAEDTGNEAGADFFREHFLSNIPEEVSFRANLVKSARAYLGVQYRWGGKSSLGLDCSGLVFMSYLENGVLIYRDAKIVEGYPVKEIPRKQLKPGDLIFFPGHVAMYLGEDRYIHSTAYKATPYVTINSLNPADEDYRDDLAHGITACGSVFAGYTDAGMTKKRTPGTDGVNCDALKENTGIVEAYWENLRRRLDALPGNVSVVYKNLSDGETFSYCPEEPHIAASVIKMFLMAAVFQGFKDGDFAPEDRIVVRREDCVPSCGVLTYLQEEPAVCIRDLVELMIIVSDNTAANVLFDLVGEERLAHFLRETLGLEKTVFARKMFDSGRAAQGIENYVTAADAAWFLEAVYRGELISPEASAEMYQILTHQRLNGKIPFYLHTFPDAPVIAHKTGEDDGTTHDVAVIESRDSYEERQNENKQCKNAWRKSTRRLEDEKTSKEDVFVLCFLGNETDVPNYERLMEETARDLYMKQMV
ncbi:MAG: serine hydrolase [Lachnospiraceae bacterium]|nr:serine hydrolase [Lachnospiraceae bacterium]